MPEQSRPVLSTRGLTKRYGGITALQDVELDLWPGEHAAIVGDNGAGKSTFVRMITGVERPSAGTIVFDGLEVDFDSPLAARNAGIETVFQHLALADDLSVPANIFLGREEVYFEFGPLSILNEKKMLRMAKQALQRTAVKIPNMKASIATMSGGQRQCVAISRSAGFASKLIIMDEPTAALGVQETQQVETIIASLKRQGTPCILISHNLRQVLALVDRVFVFRRGRLAGTLEAAKTTANEIVSMITGLQAGDERDGFA